MKLNQIWHCPRPQLAKRYLALLQAGPVVSTTIFAPRRTGKTVFLRKDLTPAAEAVGFTVAYADLWQTRLNPGIVIVRGLEEALTPGVPSLAPADVQYSLTSLKKKPSSRRRQVACTRSRAQLSNDPVNT